MLSREPKLIEVAKNTLFLEGRKCSGVSNSIVTKSGQWHSISNITIGLFQDIRRALKDFYHLKKPMAKSLSRANDLTPFEDDVKLQNQIVRNECNLFVFGSSSKKRPNNLVLGRLFEHELLDMVELGVSSFRGLDDFKNDKIATHCKPCLVFNGPKWSETEELRRLKSLFIDSFHRETVEGIRLQGIEHVISFTLTEDSKILMRSYKIQLKKSGQKTPRIELAEIGPSMDLEIRRTKIASEDLYKLARKTPKSLKPTPKRNISKDELGNTHGRIHVGRQEIDKIQTRKVRALKKTPEEKKAARKVAKAAAADE